MPFAPPVHRPPGARGAPAENRPSPLERGYDWTWRTKVAPRILARDPICAVPGCHRPSAHVDHKLPRSRGGSDDDDNLHGPCAPHNSQKADRDWPTFLAWLRKQPSR